jgi:hypothetical protein
MVVWMYQGLNMHCRHALGENSDDPFPQWRYSRSVDVTFTKVSGPRYLLTVRRRVGPVLAPAYGPGYDQYLPHDLVHFVVEAEAGLRGGVFGRVASGKPGSFWPVDPTERRRVLRRRRIVTPAEHADMAASEQLASLCAPLWELRHGRRTRPPEWFGRLTESQFGQPLIQRILDRLDDLASRWHDLAEGEGMTLTWPLPEGQRHPPREREHARAHRSLN